MSEATQLARGGASSISFPRPTHLLPWSPCLLLQSHALYPNWGGMEAQRGVTGSPPQPLDTSQEYRRSGSRENVCTLRQKSGWCDGVRVRKGGSWHLCGCRRGGGSKVNSPSVAQQTYLPKLILLYPGLLHNLGASFPGFLQRRRVGGGQCWIPRLPFGCPC